jgi:hypothetical protein
MPSPKVAPYLISQIRFAEGQIQTEKRTKIRDWEKKNPAPKEPKENEVVADIRADRYKLSKPKLEKAMVRLAKGYTIEDAEDILDIECLTNYGKESDAYTERKERVERTLSDFISNQVNLMHLKGLDPMEAIKRVKAFKV